MLGYKVTRLPQRHNNAIRVAILGSNVIDFAGATVSVDQPTYWFDQQQYGFMKKWWV